MKTLRKIVLIVLMAAGGYSAVIPNANGQVTTLVAGLGKIVGLMEKGANSAAILATTKAILSGTGEMDSKLLGLKDVSHLMSNDLSNMWKATDEFYKDLRKLSEGAEAYRDMLRFFENTRSVYGYCGSAITLASRSNTLTLQEYEYILRHAVEIQEYVQNRLERIYRLVSSNSVSMNDYERMQLLNQLANEQMVSVRDARMLVARVKGMELVHEQKANDLQFRESFLNLRL